MIDIFQTRSIEELQEDYMEEIIKIDKQIKSDPENLELYNSKIRILMYYNQFDDVLNLLDEMLEIFPKDELDIKMKKASVLRRMQEVKAGLEIILPFFRIDPPYSDLCAAYFLDWLCKTTIKSKTFQIPPSANKNLTPKLFLQDLHTQCEFFIILARSIIFD